MENEDLEKLLIQVATSANQDDCSTAFCKIVNVGEPGLLLRALAALEKVSPTHYDRRILDTAIDGLIDTLNESLPVMIDYATRHTETSVGKDCIYALGEVAYKQCLRKKSEHPDLRILPALLKILHKSDDVDPETLDACIGAISQYRYYGNIGSAKATLEQILEPLRLSTSITSYTYENLSRTIELLANINGTDKDTELEIQLGLCQSQSWLAKNIQGELAEPLS
jgi:hypothetical protein